MNTTNRNVARMAVVFGVLAFGLASGAQAQTVTITPTKGQTPQQVETDKADCNAIAQQSAASAAPPAAAAPQRGGALRGAAKGAVVAGGTANARGGSAYDRAPNAVQDEYRQDQARKGAAVGAVVGAGQQRRASAQAGQQAQAGAQQATDAAFRSCLIGRGYNVQ